MCCRCGIQLWIILIALTGGKIPGGVKLRKGTTVMMKTTVKKFETMNFQNIRITSEDKHFARAKIYSDAPVQFVGPGRDAAVDWFREEFEDLGEVTVDDKGNVFCRFIREKADGKE